MKKITTIIILSLATILSYAQTLDTKSIDEIFTEWNKEGVPGCALGIMKDGEMIYAKGYGLANLEYNIPNSENSVFRIASTSKQFTAASVVLLAEQGKLSLDDNLSQFFPEFPEYAKEITIRHLLNHTSGIRDYLTLSWLKAMNDFDYYEDEDVMKWLINQSELNFNPGDEFLYSNSGYWLLGQIVNQVAGMNMADFAKKEIFDPLGMTSTHFHNNHNQIVKYRATGYRPMGNESYQISMTTLEMIGDGGIFTTINDIKKWDDSFYEDQVLSKTFWDMMTQPGVLNNGEELHYASGLGVSEYKGHRKISHGGSFVGFKAEFMRFPDQHLSIAIFANRADADPTARAHRVADIMLDDSFVSKNAESSLKESDKNQNFIQLTKKELAEFEGNYWNDESLLARKIYIKNDTLRYARSETNETLLAPISKNEFKMLNVGVDAFVKFFKDEEGNKMMSFRQNDGEPSISKAYQTIVYTANNLADFEGEYYSKELDVIYHLKMIDGALILEIDGDEVSQLKEIMTNYFTVSDMGTIQFSTDKDGVVTDFRLAAGRVKNLVFEKK